MLKSIFSISKVVHFVDYMSGQRPTKATRLVRSVKLGSCNYGVLTDHVISFTPYSYAKVTVGIIYQHHFLIFK